MESLLQFDRPLDVKLLESACESFQSDGNKSVEAVLVAFQRHPAAWSRVSQILEQAGALSCRLLALSILQDCVSQRWSVLPADEREGIKRYVVSTIISLSSSASPVPASLSPAQHLLFLRKLDSVLVSICKHDWPLRWPELIPELVASSRSSERLCLNNLHILCLLSEEVFSFSSASLTSDASVQMKQHLSASFQQIFALCDDLLSAPGRLSAPLLQQTLLCLHSFLHWIPVGYVFETALLQRLASCLSLPSASPSIVNAVLQCLTEVAGIRLTDEQSDKYQLTLVSTLQAALQHANATVSQLQQQADDGKRSIASLYADGSDAQQDYFRYLALFLCAFLRTQSMAAFEASEQWRPLLLSGLQLLLQLSAVDDQTVFKLCLEYWNVLVAQLYDTTRTQQAQQQRERAAAAHANNPLLAIAAQSAASSGAFASSSLLPQRLQFYAPVLHELRLVIISKMAKPEEVLIVEDDNGQIVREVLKDSDAVQLYKSMREALIYLTHLSPEDTRETMLEKLARQVNGSEWSWANLSRICWAIGSISGALQESEEKIFLVRVIKDLLHFTEVKRGKDNKAVIASNIMYVVGQYPRFLKQHWKFLKTVCNKLFEFMHESHSGVADMSVDTFLKIARRCKKRFVTPPSAQEPPFVSEILLTLPHIISDLEGAQVAVFYEAVAELISAEADVSAQHQLIAALMQHTNTSWANILTMHAAWQQQQQQQGKSTSAAVELSTELQPQSSPLSSSSPLPLHHPSVCKQVLSILRINCRVCASLGSAYFPQLARLLVDLLRVYVVYSEAIAARVAAGGAQVVGAADVRGMRAVKHAVCSLFLLFIAACSEAQLPVILQHTAPMMLQPLCDDYKQQQTPPQCRESAVLLLAADCVKRLSLPAVSQAASALPPNAASSSLPLSSSAVQPMAVYVPRLIDSLFLPTLPMITANFTDYVEHRTALYSLLQELTSHQLPALLQLPAATFHTYVDVVKWGMKHIDRLVQEQGCDCMLTLLSAMPQTQQAQHFYTAYYTSIVSDTLGLLTDTLHKHCLSKHCRLLQLAFHLLQQQQITVPLWQQQDVPPPSSPHHADFANNASYVRAFVTRLLQAAFPHIAPSLVAAFVSGLMALHSREQEQAFKQHVRDFLINIRQFSTDQTLAAAAAAAGASSGSAGSLSSAAASGPASSAADVDDLFTDEREAALQAEQRREQQRLEAVPGLIYIPTPSFTQLQQQTMP